MLNAANGHDPSLCVQSGTGIVWTPFHVFLDVEMHVTVSECNVFRGQFVVKSRKTPNQLFVASLHGVDIDYRDL